jgi:hypothetical protein
VYDPRSKGAETYRELAREVAIRPAPEGPMATFEDLPTVVVPPVQETASSAIEETASSAMDESDVPPDDAVERRSTARVAGDRDADVPRVKPPAPTVRPPDVGEAPPDASEAPSDAGRPDVGEAPPEAGEAASGEREAEPARVERPSAETLDVRTGQATPGGEEDLWEEADRAPEARVQIVGTLGGDVPERHVVVIDESADLDLQGARERPGREPGPAAPAPNEAPDDDAATIGATLEDEEPGPRRRWRLFRKGGD